MGHSNGCWTAIHESMRKALNKEIIRKMQLKSKKKLTKKDTISEYPFWRYLVGHFNFFHPEEPDTKYLTELLKEWGDARWVNY